MGKRLLLLAGLLLFCARGAARADLTFTIYTDRAAWEAAVGTFLEEKFEDFNLNPGLSVVSQWGHIDSDNQCWTDLANPQWSTTWLFDTPKGAFGGTWNLAYDNMWTSGLRLRVWVPSLSQWAGLPEVVPGPYNNQFWGFVASEPFTQVYVSYTDGWEHYRLDDMVYGSITPEPGSLLCIGGGLALLARRRWKRRPR